MSIVYRLYCARRRCARTRIEFDVHERTGKRLSDKRMRDGLWSKADDGGTTWDRQLASGVFSKPLQFRQANARIRIAQSVDAAGWSPSHPFFHGFLNRLSIRHQIRKAASEMPTNGDSEIDQCNFVAMVHRKCLPDDDTTD